MSFLPEAGQYLYASCAGEDYGRILVVGQDENGVPCIDIEVYNVDGIISFEDDEDFRDALTTIELPKGINLILRKVQYRYLDPSDPKFIVCNTPGNNCFRCTKLFALRDERTKW